jgi:hypothetical protein
MTPLYIFPDNGTSHSGWDNVTNAKKTHADVPFIAIINPNSGFVLSDPTHCNDSLIDVTAYKKSTPSLTNAGVKVLGYVDTNPDTKSETSVENEINNYKNCLPTVTGIFFDDMTNDANIAHEQYYRDLTTFAEVTDGMTYTVGNPGTSTDQGYIGTVDNLVIHEDPFLPTTGELPSRTWYPTFGKGDFSFLAFNITSSSINQAVITGDSNYVGYLYTTDNTGCGTNPVIPTSNCVDSQRNPWNTTSTYLNRTADYLEP